MFRFLISLLAGAVLGGAAPITYTMVNNTVGAGSITGNIETDGVIGIVSQVDILTWSLLLNDGTTTFDLFGPPTGNSQVFESGADLSATATELLYNFSGSGFLLLQNPTIGSNIHYFCVAAVTTCDGSPAGESLSITGAGANQFTARIGTQAIATVGGVAPPATTPEPSTFALIGIGGALVFFGRKSPSRT